MTNLTKIPAMTAIVVALGVTAAACSSDSGRSTSADAEPTSSAAAATDASAAPTTEPSADVVAVGATTDVACPTEGEEWETAKVYIEHNATDADTGFHGVFGGEAWRELCLTDPDGNRLFLVDPQSQLGDLAVSDFIFESREPPNDEYSPDDLRADFPEGEYTVAGTDHEGVARIGAATFTHAIPAEPELSEPAVVDEPEIADDATVPAGGFLVAWEPVTETIDGGPVTISGYEVIVTMEEFEDPYGNARPVYDVHLGPDSTSLAVPEGFLTPDTVYEIEVLALEESGNQTITVGFVRTE